MGRGYDTIDMTQSIANYSIYSFVAWIATFVVYTVFFLWAILPYDFIYQYGITYYPSRYYAIALPAYIIVVYFVVNLSYIGWNMLNTLEPEDYGTFRDPHGSKSASPMYVRCGGKDGIPNMGDIDPMQISKLLK